MPSIHFGMDDGRTLTCEDDIDSFVSSLDTGDIVFFTAGKFHSIISFTIEFICHSEWTHSGIIVRDPETDTVLVWESVNHHRETSTFVDFRTKTVATGSGARLIDFGVYIKGGYGCMKKDGKLSCMFAVLKLDKKWKANTDLQNEIQDYILKKTTKTKQVYPASIVPLAASWYDGWQSLFTSCGLFTTYEAQVMNLPNSSVDIPKIHSHYNQKTDQDHWPKEEEVFCSQLVIEVLEHTTYFASNIPCNEWTVEDLTVGSHINQWFKKYHGRIGYEEHIRVMTMICSKN